MKFLFKCIFPHGNSKPVHYSLVSFSNYFDIGLLKKISSLERHEYFLRWLGSVSSVDGVCIHYLIEMRYKGEI